MKVQQLVESLSKLGQQEKEVIVLVKCLKVILSIEPSFDCYEIVYDICRCREEDDTYLEKVPVLTVAKLVETLKTYDQSKEIYLVDDETCKHSDICRVDEHARSVVLYSTDEH